MGHKSAETRKEEARQRKLLAIPALEAKVARAYQAWQEQPGMDIQRQEMLEGVRSRLERAYVEVGRSAIEARGMADAIAEGRPAGTWVSGRTMRRKEPEPTTIEGAVTAIAAQGAKGLALVQPHPFRAAILVSWPDGQVPQVIVNMSILHVDDLIQALGRAGVAAERPAVATTEMAKECWSA